MIFDFRDGMIQAASICFSQSFCSVVQKLACPQFLKAACLYLRVIRKACSRTSSDYATSLTQRDSQSKLRRLLNHCEEKESVVATIAIWRPMSEQAAFLCAMSYVSAFSFPLSSSLPGYCDVVARKLQVLPFIRGALVRFRSFGGMPRVSLHPTPDSHFGT